MNFVLPACVFFDLDGTLLDSLPGIEFSIRAALGVCGLPLLQPDLRKLIGPPIRSILAEAAQVSDSARLDALEQAFRSSYDSEGWRRTVCFPGAAAVLEALRSTGHQMFVVSNKPRGISLRILEHLGIAGFFDAILTRDSRVPAFPGKAEMLAHLLSAHDLAPADCILVGDTMEDAAAAAAAGLRFICMTHGYGSVVDPLSPLPTCSLPDFSCFLPLISKELVRD